MTTVTIEYRPQLDTLRVCAREPRTAGVRTSEDILGGSIAVVSDAKTREPLVWDFWAFKKRFEDGKLLPDSTVAKIEGAFHVSGGLNDATMADVLQHAYDKLVAAAAR